MMKLLKKYFKKPKLSREAFIAYFHRLPHDIQVSWMRDGEFIIGKIVTDNNEFMTQGRNVDEFIEMVNDAVYTIYDIPLEYVDIIKQVKTYEPKPEEKEKLENVGIKNYSIFLKKKEEREIIKLA